MSQAAIFNQDVIPSDDAAQLEMFPEFSILSDSGMTAATEAAALRAAELWQKLLPEASRWLGEAAATNWLGQLTATGLSDDTFILAAPSALVQNWVQSRYSDDLLRLLRRFQTGLRFIHIYVDEQTAAPVAVEETQPVEALPALILGAPVDPRLTFANFVTDASNQLAFGAAMRVASSAAVEFNPLYIHGGVGLGKTHLLHAIANEIQGKQPGRRVLYLSAEQFMYHFIRALREKNTFSFKEMFRTVDVLMIDDVQFIAGKESTQEEFFHTFNALTEQGKQVILSGDRAPGDLSGVGARLTSRMGMGLVVDIQPSSYDLRLSVLARRALASGTAYPPEVLAFIATHITSNIRELEGAFNRLSVHAQITGAKIDMEFARRVLADQLRTAARRVTIEDIQKATAQHFGLRLQDLLAQRRTRSLARPRQLAMYLCKQLTTCSLPEIGRAFGGRDHTTIAHGVKAIEALLLTDTTIADATAELRRTLT